MGGLGRGMCYSHLKRSLEGGGNATVSTVPRNSKWPWDGRIRCGLKTNEGKKA